MDFRRFFLVSKREVLDTLYWTVTHFLETGLFVLDVSGTAVMMS